MCHLLRIIVGLAVLAVIAGGPVLAEQVYPHTPRPYSLADYYGYAPDRVFPTDMGWYPDTTIGMHSTEYETFPDFFRTTIGWGASFERSYLYELNDYPFVTQPGQMVIRARRDTTLGEIKMMISNQSYSAGIRVAGNEQLIKDVYDAEQDNNVSWAKSNYTQWHNYIFRNDGTNLTFSIDSDPALTLTLAKGATVTTNPYLTTGHSAVVAFRYFDIQSVQFLGLDDPIPAPPAAPSMNGHYATYYENGQPRTEGTYVNGVPVGKFVSYFENGQRESEGLLDDSGRQQDLWRYWYDNGQNRKEVVFTDGVYDGKFHRWPVPGYEDQQGQTTLFVNGGNGGISYWTINPDAGHGEMGRLLYWLTHNIDVSMTVTDTAASGTVEPTGFVYGTEMRFYDHDDILWATLNGEPIEFDNSQPVFRSVKLTSPGTLEVAFVPEPGMLWLLGLAASALIRRGGKRGRH